MAHNRRIGRKDATHDDIFNRARELGAVTIEITATGLKQDKKNPDGFIWHPNCGWQAIEAKGGPRTPIKPGQAELATRAPIHFMNSPDQMSDLILGTLDVRGPAAKI